MYIISVMHEEGGVGELQELQCAYNGKDAGKERFPVSLFPRGSMAQIRTAWYDDAFWPVSTTNHALHADCLHLYFWISKYKIASRYLKTEYVNRPSHQLPHSLLKLNGTK